MITSMEKRRLFMSGLAGLLVVTLLVMLVGCYGGFPLTKAIYRFNGEVGEKLVQTLVFWVFIILPVYSIAMLGDAIIFNLVEFWTGTKLIVSASQAQPDGTMVTLAPDANGRDAVLSVTRDGRMITSARFVRVSDSQFAVYDPQGKLTGKVMKTADGGFNLTNAKGAVVSTISPQMIAAIPAQGRI